MWSKGRFWVAGGGRAVRQQRLPCRLVGADAVLLRQRRPARRAGRRGAGRPHLRWQLRPAGGRSARRWCGFLSWRAPVLASGSPMPARRCRSSVRSTRTACWPRSARCRSRCGSRRMPFASRRPSSVRRLRRSRRRSLLVIAVVLPFIVKPIAARRWADAHTIVNPLTPPLTMEGEGVGPAGRSSPRLREPTSAASSRRISS